MSSTRLPSNIDSSHRIVVRLALLAYLFVGAIVPQGHMAAALASGTLFHLCPGDLRSAWVIDALAVEAPDSTHGHHHHHHHSPVNEVADDPVVEKSSADPGCTFSGERGVAPIIAAAPDEAAAVESAPVILRRELAPTERIWLRPPPRSPPS